MGDRDGPDRAEHRIPAAGARPRRRPLPAGGLRGRACGARETDAADRRRLAGRGRARWQRPVSGCQRPRRAAVDAAGLPGARDRDRRRRRAQPRLGAANVGGRAGRAGARRDTGGAAELRARQRAGHLRTEGALVERAGARLQRDAVADLPRASEGAGSAPAAGKLDRRTGPRVGALGRGGAGAREDAGPADDRRPLLRAQRLPRPGRRDHREAAQPRDPGETRRARQARDRCSRGGARGGRLGGQLGQLRGRGRRVERAGERRLGRPNGDHRTARRLRVGALPLERRPLRSVRRERRAGRAAPALRRPAGARGR